MSSRNNHATHSSKTAGQSNLRKGEKEHFSGLPEIEINAHIAAGRKSSRRALIPEGIVTPNQSLVSIDTLISKGGSRRPRINQNQSRRTNRQAEKRPILPPRKIGAFYPELLLSLKDAFPVWRKILKRTQDETQVIGYSTGSAQPKLDPGHQDREGRKKLEEQAQQEQAQQEQAQQEQAQQEQAQQEQAQQEQTQQEQTQQEQTQQEQARQEQTRQEQTRQEQTQQEQKRQKEIIAAAELAVIASRKTGDLLPGYFYDLAGVKRPYGVSDL